MYFYMHVFVTPRSHRRPTEESHWKEFKQLLPSVNFETFQYNRCGKKLKCW
jgi:hypothetical protein